MSKASRDPQPLSKIAVLDQESIDSIVAQLPVGGYTHPSTHPASMITESVNQRFVNDTEKETWNGKQDLLLFTPVANDDYRLTNARTPTTHSHDYEPSDANIQTHITSSHAPSTAQKNSDITKGEIEEKLTGVISTHSHSGGSGDGFIINVQALTSSPVDSQTVYFGMLPKAPITTANVSKIYIRKACTLKMAEIYCYSGTAGTAEAWSLYVRKNNTADTLIKTLTVNTNERVFSNTALNITLVAGDYLEIKGVQPLWATNPLTCIYAGYLYFE